MTIRYDSSAPAGWGVDETGHFAKVPSGYVLQNGQYVAPGSASTPTNQQSQPNPGFNTTPSAPVSAPVQSQDQINALRSQGINLSAYGAPQSGDVSYLRGSLDSDYDDVRPIVANVNGTMMTVGFTGTYIPRTTVVGPDGQRITVRTDNKTGKYRTLAEMQAQGYQAEKAPGIPTNNTQYSNSVGTDLAFKPSLTLTNGQVISPSDPNYDVYKNLQGTKVNSSSSPTSNASSPAPTNQPVPVGPSLFNQLVSQGLTESDIQRQGADIFIKPTSRFYSQVAGTSGASGTPNASGTSAPGATGASGGVTPNVVDPTDKAWVNSFYQKYFDRDASSSELANWSKETPQALQQFLQKEAKSYGYTSKYFQDDSQKRLDAALQIINGSNLPPDIKTLWAATVRTYPSGMEYNANEILNTFNQLKSDTIDPQFRELASIATTDFKRALDQQKSAYEMTQEKVNADAGQNIRQAKEGLEASGMTFTGKAVQDLGAQSAYAQPGANQQATIPNQEAFGGLFHEGTVNQQNRLMASSAALQNKTTIDALNSTLEKQVGSGAAATAGAMVNGGITGTLETQRQSQYAQTLNQVIDNYRKKQELNTNITK